MNATADVIYTRNEFRKERINAGLDVNQISRIVQLPVHIIRRIEMNLNSVDPFTVEMYRKGLKEYKEKADKKYYDKHFPNNVNEMENKRQAVMELILERLENADYNKVLKAAKKLGIDVD